MFYFYQQTLNINLDKLILLRMHNSKDMYQLMTINSTLVHALDEHFWWQKLAIEKIVYPRETSLDKLISAYHNFILIKQTYYSGTDKYNFLIDLFTLNDLILIKALYNLFTVNEEITDDNAEILLHIKNLTKEKIEFLESLNPLFTTYFNLLDEDSAMILLPPQSREFYRYCIVERKLPFGHDALRKALERNEPLDFYEFLFSLPEVKNIIDTIYDAETYHMISDNRLDLFQFFKKLGFQIEISEKQSLEVWSSLFFTLRDAQEFPLLDYLSELAIYPTFADVDRVTNLALLEWLKSHEIWPENSDYAILTVNSAAMAWLLQEEIYPTPDGADQAVEDENIAALDYMADLNVMPTQDAIRRAKYHDRSKSKEWLRKHGYKL